MIHVSGLEMPSLHHMECGSSRVSALQRDKSLFERFYTFVTYLVWVCFKRKDISTIECEVGRILKSNYFNPFARPRVDANHTSFIDRAKMSETSYLRYPLIQPADTFCMLHGGTKAIFLQNMKNSWAVHENFP